MIRKRKLDDTRDLALEDVNEAWFWQLMTNKRALPQKCLPRNRYG